MFLIGCATEETCVNQLEALPRSGLSDILRGNQWWRYEMLAVISGGLLDLWAQ